MVKGVKVEKNMRRLDLIAKDGFEKKTVYATKEANMPGKGDNVVAGVVECVFYQETVVKNRLVQKGAFVQRGCNNGDKGDIVKENNFIKEGTVVGGVPNIEMPQTQPNMRRVWIWQRPDATC